MKRAHVEFELERYLLFLNAVAKDFSQLKS